MLHLSEQQLTLDDEVLKKHGRSFYWASFFLPRRARALAATLYEFCRWVDDAVDEAPSKKEALVSVQRLQDVLDSEGESQPRFENLFRVLGEYGLGMAPAQELLLGVKSDLQTVNVKNEEELLLYCYRVAGTVGLMMCPILGVRDEAAMRYAIDLGIAMQLTNISRDVLEDAHKKRIYLPQTWLQSQIRPEHIIKDREVQERVPMCVNRALGLADVHYQSAIKGLVYIPWRARLAICVAMTLYRHIGEKIRKQWRGDSLKGRMYVRPLEKVVCVSKGLMVFCKTLFKNRPGRAETILAKHSTLRMLPGVN